MLGERKSSNSDFMEDEPLINIRTQKRSCCQRCFDRCLGCCSNQNLFCERSIIFEPPENGGVSMEPNITYPPNVIRNQKYSVITFIPKFLFEQFRFFFNLYFLLVALTQFIPTLQVGFLFTYIAPLVFVLSVTMCKEFYDDFQRFLRDREANNEMYERLTPNGTEAIPSSAIRVGDLIVLHADQRVPADMVLLRTHDKTGSVFIRTDQLDGETDWKLRRAIASLQHLPSDQSLFNIKAQLNCAAPEKAIYRWTGNFQLLSHEYGQFNEQHSDQEHTSAAGVGGIESLSLENTLWANTVLANGPVVAVVIFTGKETRSVMNTNQPPTKVGRLDEQVNQFSKVLFVITVIMAGAITALKGFIGLWYIYFFRFVLLFSSIIPISMRVNLDMGKTLYSIMMMRDKMIPKTVVRTSTIPEELGRISFLFSDKTGTLTRNVMTFKALQLEPPIGFNKDSLPALRTYLKEAFGEEEKDAKLSLEEVLEQEEIDDRHDFKSSSGKRIETNYRDTKQYFEDEDQDEQEEGQNMTAASVASLRGSINQHVGIGIGQQDEDEDDESTSSDDHHSSVSNMSELIIGKDGLLPSDSLSLSTFVDESKGSSSSSSASSAGKNLAEELEKQGIPSGRVQLLSKSALVCLALCHNVTPVMENGSREYQASSPDEVALVKFAEKVGLRLEHRTPQLICLRTPNGFLLEYDILNIFPFTSETRCMGIIVKLRTTNQITFYMKGAEQVMKQKTFASDWIDEEVDNLARVGLRTLVLAEKHLDQDEYSSFQHKFQAAKAVIKNRESHVLSVRQTLEKHMTLIGLTGVEDKLQEHVKTTLETLRNAGIRIWMLTGDKAETAICIGISARLIDRGQQVFSLIVKNKRDAARQLDLFGTKINACLVIDGESLAICLENFEREFLDLAAAAPSVICCRCSPTQKATMVRLMQEYSGKRAAAIGDGGNDVSMIQEADVGIGIVGKEGKQASLAADFSIQQFSYISRLILWHGRNAYQRSARLGQFVIHRGLIISIIQAVFSSLFFYAAIPIYNGWLMVGYATFYTMFPVFSFVLDEDVDVTKVFLYPQLYKELQKGRPLSWKTFYIWVFKSVYQGGVIMVLAIVLFEDNFLNVISITFTALILSELLNVALEINTWHWLMILSQIFSLATYFISMLILRSYFDITFIFTKSFAWKVSVITSISCLPPAIVKWCYRRYNPSLHRKVNLT